MTTRRSGIGYLAAVGAVAVAVGGCLLSTGCGTLKHEAAKVKELVAHTTNTWGEVQTLLLNLKHGAAGAVTNETTPIPFPVVGNHGEAVRVISPDGNDSWMQYPDGYFDRGDGQPAGFVQALDRYSLPGWGLVLENAGGRNCGRAAITGVVCEVLSTTTDLHNESGQQVTSPDKVHWTVQLSDGCTIDFVYRHMGDYMDAARVSDQSKGVHAWQDCNGYPCGDGSRCYNTVADADGNVWQVGIRMVAPDAPVLRGR